MSWAREVFWLRTSTVESIKFYWFPLASNLFPVFKLWIPGWVVMSVLFFFFFFLHNRETAPSWSSQAHLKFARQRRSVQLTLNFPQPFKRAALTERRLNEVPTSLHAHKDFHGPLGIPSFLFFPPPQITPFEQTNYYQSLKEDVWEWQRKGERKWKVGNREITESVRLVLNAILQLPCWAYCKHTSKEQKYK